MLLACERLEHLASSYPVRGLRGAVGTQLDQLTLFGNNAGTATELDDLIPENRSYTEWLVGQDFFFSLTSRMRLDLKLQYRQRDATTPFMEDLARFDRVDRRYRGAIVFVIELTKNLDLRARAAYTRNDSDRIDPTILTDEVGYEESTAGIGLRYKF